MRKCSLFNPLPDDKILDWSKLKQSADDNFELDVNSRKFSKLVENTVGKGDEQFLLFAQCFQRACFPGSSKGVIVWEWVKSASVFDSCTVMNIFELSDSVKFGFPESNVFTFNA